MCSVAPNDAEYGSRGAMPRISRETKLTLSTAGVDFSYYTLAHQLVLRCGFDDANKFMSDGSFKSGITASNF